MTPETPIEHQWYLAKYIADDMRQETRNVAVVLRAANTELPRIRFLDPVPFLREDHRKEWSGWMSYWTDVWAKHGGLKPFFWMLKPSQYSPHFRWEHAGSRLVRIVDFDVMFDVLVKPENR